LTSILTRGAREAEADKVEVEAEDTSGYHSLIIIALYLFLNDMIGYIGSKTGLMNIERGIISKALQYIDKFIQTTFIKIK
jgi:hypothetical protein